MSSTRQRRKWAQRRAQRHPTAPKRLFPGPPTRKPIKVPYSPYRGSLRKRLSYGQKPYRAVRTQTKRGMRSRILTTLQGQPARLRRKMHSSILHATRVQLPHHQIAGQLRKITCKPRPSNNRSKGGGSRPFIPWCNRRK
ncbi:hypothetical protein [Eel River basin pequenovirus]|nr:hypothetical protein [Eel River basin pequenovirus]